MTRLAIFHTPIANKARFQVQYIVVLLRCDADHINTLNNLKGATYVA